MRRKFISAAGRGIRYTAKPFDRASVWADIKVGEPKLAELMTELNKAFGRVELVRLELNGELRVDYERR